MSQVAKFTGISTRTLQYYDEIGLLKPSELTQSGYRLYDEEALQRLQQILFFKEFDLTDYIHALEDFKNNSTKEIIKHWGSVENFDRFISKVKEDESEVAKLAIQQFGSIEAYTEAMKYNLEHFSEIMEKHQIHHPDLIQKSDALYSKLTSDMQQDAGSEKIQSIVKEIIAFTQETTFSQGLGAAFWDTIIKSYSNELVKAVNDKKYGAGASEYIAAAFRHYFRNHTSETN